MVSRPSRRRRRARVPRCTSSKKRGGSVGVAWGRSGVKTCMSCPGAGRAGGGGVGWVGGEVLGGVSGWGGGWGGQGGVFGIRGAALGQGYTQGLDGVAEGGVGIVRDRYGCVPVSWGQEEAQFRWDVHGQVGPVHVARMPCLRGWWSGFGVVSGGVGVGEPGARSCRSRFRSAGSWE